MPTYGFIPDFFSSSFSSLFILVFLTRSFYSSRSWRLNNGAQNKYVSPSPERSQVICMLGFPLLSWCNRLFITSKVILEKLVSTVYRLECPHPQGFQFSTFSYRSHPPTSIQLTMLIILSHLLIKLEVFFFFGVSSRKCSTFPSLNKQIRSSWEKKGLC